MIKVPGDNGTKPPVRLVLEKISSQGETGHLSSQRNTALRAWDSTEKVASSRTESGQGADLCTHRSQHREHAGSVKRHAGERGMWYRDDQSPDQSCACMGHCVPYTLIWCTFGELLGTHMPLLLAVCTMCTHT